MKKIVALLCALIMLTACCITANAATLTLTPDKEIAKEHGYTIHYYLEDGWEVPLYYLNLDKDVNPNIPNKIEVFTDGELDISQYVKGEVADFYGVEIIDIEYFMDSIPAEMKPFYENSLNKYCYTLTTTKFYTSEEAKNLFKDCDFVRKSNIYEIATELLIDESEPVACDVNFDNNFDTMDYITVKRAYFGTYNEADMHCNKGDLNNNLEIDAMDSALMKRAYFDLFTVEE